MKASDLFIKALENEGVEYIFGIPGEENLDLLESLRKSSIKLVLTRHEQAAGFMAATYGRLTGKPGVCISTLGPGATNLVTAAAYAQLGAMPMLMITGQKPIKSSKQGRFQILNVVDMFRSITKSTETLVNGNKIPSLIRESFRLAVEERPGAVHIELPEDIAIEDVKERLFTPIEMNKPHSPNTAVNRAIKMIEEAKRPLLLIGAGANRTRASQALSFFVSKFNFPFVNTQMGKGVVDERSPLYLGTAALSSDDFVHCAIEKADLIINVGHDVIEKPPFFMEEDKAKVIHINFFPAVIDDVYFPNLNVIGDIATSVGRIAERLTKSDNWDFDIYKDLKIDIESHITKYFEDKRFPLLPQRLIKITRDKLDEDSIISLDNGVYKIWFARNFKAYRSQTLLLDNALASMGAGLPSAMAAKMLNPNKKVVAVVGDGGFMMNSQEMETAVRENLDLVIIVLNDGSNGMIRWKQQDMGLEDFGLTFNNPDFVKYAESYGASGHRPQSSDEFEEIFEKCLNSKGVHLIDLKMDYSLNHPILNKKLKETKC
jgi:acetolactate synthase-1/2/3 large subunit